MRHLQEGAQVPTTLLEARVIDRFGWTLQELDNQDDGRTLQMLQTLNLAAAYDTVMRAIDMHKPEVVSAASWRAYKALIDLASEYQADQDQGAA